MITRKAKITLTLFLLFQTSSALATGALPYCFGAKSCQMGGAGAAITLDTTSGNTNPALMANAGRDTALHPLFVFQNERVNTSQTRLTQGTPFSGYTKSIPNHVKFYAAGYSGLNYDINPKYSIGFSQSGGGNNARYRQSIISPQLSAPRKVMSAAGLLSPILSYKPNCNSSYGFGLVIGYLQMKNNLTQFPSGQVTQGANKWDWGMGLGARIGGQWKLVSQLSFGLSGSTPVWFQKLHKYQDVILYRPRLPAIITGGLAWHINKSTDFLFDVDGLFWKSSPNFSKAPPAGQGWKNTPAYKFGIQHQLVQKLTVRAGYYFGPSPIPHNNVVFNALNEVIVVSEHIASAGFTIKPNEAIGIDIGGAYMFNNKITDNGRGVAGPAAQGTSVRARAIVVSLGFNMKY